jgi:uncharacterized protein (TIGR03437 family)
MSDLELVVDDTVPAPLAWAAGPVIEMQLPSVTMPGMHRVAARIASTGELLAGSSVVVNATAPGLFVREDSTSGVIANADGTDNSSINLAARNTIVRVLGTGPGPVEPPVADGDAAVASRTIANPASDAQECYRDSPVVCAYIDDVFALVERSELAPGMVGVWQLSIKVPQSITGRGVKSLRAVINGASSNVVGIWVQ